MIGGIASRGLNFVVPGAGTLANTLGNAYYGTGPLGGIFGNRGQAPAGGPAGGGMATQFNPGQFNPGLPYSPGVPAPYNPINTMIQNQYQQGIGNLDARMNAVQQGIQGQINAIAPSAPVRTPSAYNQMSSRGLGFGSSGGGSMSLAQLNDVLTLQGMAPRKSV